MAYGSIFGYLSIYYIVRFIYAFRCIIIDYNNRLRESLRRHIYSTIVRILSPATAYESLICQIGCFHQTKDRENR